MCQLYGLPFIGCTVKEGWGCTQISWYSKSTGPSHLKGNNCVILEKNNYHEIDRTEAFVHKFEVLIRLSNKSSFTILFTLIVKKGKKQECNPVAEIKNKIKLRKTVRKHWI